MAVDNTNPHQPIFYVTEDHERGALRKYTPAKSFGANGQMEEASWDSLHSDGGTTEYLLFKNGGRFTWTTNEEQARASQQQFYKNVEGIDYHSGKLYFVSKKLLMLYVLDLGRGTYTQSSTKFGVLTGGGEFRHQPDQLVHNNAGDYLYLTEGKCISILLFVHCHPKTTCPDVEIFDCSHFAATKMVARPLVCMRYINHLGRNMQSLRRTRKSTSMTRRQGWLSLQMEARCTRHSRTVVAKNRRLAWITPADVCWNSAETMGFHLMVLLWV